MGLPVGLSSPVLVSSQGRVRWLTPIILESACKLHVRYFPFDEQFCRVEFVPWSHDEHEILLTAENDGMEDILSNYTGKEQSYTIIHLPPLFTTLVLIMSAAAEALGMCKNANI